MTEHTELPWSLPDYKNPYIVTNKNGVVVCAALLRNGKGCGIKSQPEQEANAAFIVKACNNHYQLFAALRRAYVFMAIDLGIHNEAVRQIKKAIARAEE